MRTGVTSAPEAVGVAWASGPAAGGGGGAGGGLCASTGTVQPRPGMTMSATNSAAMSRFGLIKAPIRPFSRPY